VNLDKTGIVGVGVQPNVVEEMAKWIWLSNGSFPLDYLRMLVGTNMRHIRNWKPVMEKFYTLCV